jgi:hypothetical protein
MKKLLSCAICMLLMVSLTFVTDTFVNAEDPPGGNPALTWNGDIYFVDVIDQADCVRTTPCLEQKCYRWDVTYLGWDYKSFSAAGFYDFGYCNSDNNTIFSCYKHTTVDCAYVTLFFDEDCTETDPSFYRILYVFDACPLNILEPIE